MTTHAPFAQSTPPFHVLRRYRLQGNGVELAALIFVLGRAAFAVLYYSGVPFIRVPAFVMGTFSTLYIAYALFTSGLM